MCAQWYVLSSVAKANDTYPIIDMFGSISSDGFFYGNAIVKRV